ncbi:MAG: hypothetical protein KAJ42_18845, partial [Gemmatimonadetes bacterium]|nr:hypothetical protein [Gemmatimonadota bacterium]
TPDGTVWREVAEKVEEFVASRDIDGGSVTLDRVVVDASQPGVARGRVTVRVPDGALFETAVDAFLGKDSVAVDAETDAAEGEGATGADAAAVDAAQPAMDSPAEEEDPDTAQAEEPPSLEDLEFKDLHRLDVRIVGPSAFRTITLRPEDPWGTKTDGAFRPGSDQPFSLPGLYQIGGLYRDTNQDLVPDETAAYLSLSGAGAAGATVDLATRIGLETAGIRLPLVRIAAQENDPTTLGFPILMGTDHYQIDRLREEGKLPATDVDGGEGFVQLVDNAFGEKGAMAVGGADEDGLGAITDWVARRVPYLWQYGKGEYRLADAETEVRRFLQGRKAPGQLALALTKLGVWMDRMAEDPPSRVEVELAAEKAPDGLADVAADVIRERFPGAEVDVRTFPTGFGVG